MNSVDSIKVGSSVKVPKFDKHLKKVGGHIGRNVVDIAIKIKTIVRKPLRIMRFQADNRKNWNMLTKHLANQI